MLHAQLQPVARHLVQQQVVQQIEEK